MMWIRFIKHQSHEMHGVCELKDEILSGLRQVHWELAIVDEAHLAVDALRQPMRVQEDAPEYGG
jgi:hypothetical protein